MRSPATWLIVSIALNVALCMTLLSHQRSVSAIPQVSTPVIVKTQQFLGPFRVMRTNIVVETRNLKWKDIESADYFQYVANLRAFGCPEQTIRDIIIADVNQLYAKRRASLVVGEDDQWWRSEPDMDLLLQSASRVEHLDNERRILLTQLLGFGWESSSPTEPKSIDGDALKFTGPVLSQLAPETENAVRAAWGKLNQHYSAYLAQCRAEGKPEDPLATARMRREFREQLEQKLNPAQVEEFLLRNSRLGGQMRGDLAGFDTTQEEFRAIFRARDAADRRLMSSTFATGEAYQQERLRLESEAEAAIQRTLGPERYKEYQLNLDPAYRESRSLAEDYGGAPESVLPLYEIKKALYAEEQAVRHNRSLSVEERVAALETIKIQTERAVRQILGEEAYNRYRGR